MAALTGGASIAVGLLQLAAAAMEAARDADAVLRETGATDHPEAVAAKRRLAASTVFWSDHYQQAIDAEERRREQPTKDEETEGA